MSMLAALLRARANATLEGLIQHSWRSLNEPTPAGYFYVCGQVGDGLPAVVHRQQQRRLVLPGLAAGVRGRQGGDDLPRREGTGLGARAVRRGGRRYVNAV